MPGDPELGVKEIEIFQRLSKKSQTGKRVDRIKKLVATMQKIAIYYLKGREQVQTRPK